MERHHMRLLPIGFILLGFTHLTSVAAIGRGSVVRSPTDEIVVGSNKHPQVVAEIQAAQDDDRGVRKVGTLDGEDDDDEEDDDEEEGFKSTPMEILAGHKVWLQVGWLVGFIVGMFLCILYAKIHEWLAPHEQIETSELAPTAGGAMGLLWTLLNHNLIFLGIIVFIAFVNLCTFVYATEVLYTWQEDSLEEKWPLLLNQIVAVASSGLFVVISVLRLAATCVDPRWSRYGITAPLRYAIASPSMFLEIIALIVTLPCNPLFGQQHQTNVLWLFCVRCFEEISANARLGFGVQRLKLILSEDAKLLLVGWLFGGVIWIIMSGLYFLTNKDCPEDGCPETADWPPYRYKYFWSEEPLPWRKFESIPSSAWFVLINLCKEHPLADAHQFLWQRVNVCIVCIFAMPLFALPMSILSYSILRTAKEPDEEEPEQIVVPIGGLDGNSRWWKYGQHATTTRQAAAAAEMERRFDPSFGLVLTALISYGTIAIHWFHTARGQDYAWPLKGIDPRIMVEINAVVSVLFAVEWALHVCCFSPWYLITSLGLIDLVSWLVGLVHIIAFFRFEEVPPWIVSLVVLRVFKMERYLGNFTDFWHITKKNKMLLLASLCLSMIVWVAASTAFYITDGCILKERPEGKDPIYQCRNNDDEVTLVYASMWRTLWAEIINVHGEWPWADYTPAGKAVGTVIAIFAIMLFSIPISIFAEGYQEHIEANSPQEEDYDRRPWQAKCRPTGPGLGQIAYDILYAHVHRKVGERPLLFRLLRGLSVFLVLLNVVVTMVCTVSKEDVREGWQLGNNYDHLMAVCYYVDVVCLIFFALELSARILATEARHVCSFVGMADMISLAGLAMTVGDLEFRKKAFHPNYDSANIRDDINVLMRVLRLFCLESYTSGMHVLWSVMWLNRWPLLRSGQTLMACWCVHANLLYLCERAGGVRQFTEGKVSEDMSARYADMLLSLQYSIVHLFGDFPEWDYGLFSRIVHFFGIMLGMSCLAAFAGVFSASFVNYVKREREEEWAYMRALQLQKAARVAMLVQKAFRKWRKRALGQDQAPHTTRRIVRQRSNVKRWAMMVTEGNQANNGRKLRIALNALLVLNVVSTMVMSMPELDADEGAVRWLWQVLVLFEFICTAIFTVEFMLALLVTTKSTRGWRKVDCLALLPGYGLAFFLVLSDGWTQDEKEPYLSLLQALSLFRVIRVLNFPYIRREVLVISKSIADAWQMLAIPAYLSFSVWVATSALFMWLEHYFQPGSTWSEAENMSNLPSAMYWCCIFLTGEWANVDFTFPGSRLCIFYVLFGVAAFSIPVGILVEAIQSSAMLAQAEEHDFRRMLSNIHEYSESLPQCETPETIISSWTQKGGNVWDAAATKLSEGSGPPSESRPPSESSRATDFGLGPAQGDFGLSRPTVPRTTLAVPTCGQESVERQAQS